MKFSLLIVYCEFDKSLLSTLRRKNIRPVGLHLKLNGYTFQESVVLWKSAQGASELPEVIVKNSKNIYIVN